ncbi:hypothetical protein VNO77_16756 [Canavalia gladiata]|uniref:Uncharacterized protein n=1 Tax=Canavalia gladiata TaxID=3824 RepID=A0AAN9LID8_CANGL
MILIDITDTERSQLQFYDDLLNVIDGELAKTADDGYNQTLMGPENLTSVSLIGAVVFSNDERLIIINYCI